MRLGFIALLSDASVSILSKAVIYRYIPRFETSSGDFEKIQQITWPLSNGTYCFPSFLDSESIVNSMSEIDRFSLGTLVTCYRENQAVSSIVDYLYGCQRDLKNGELKAGNLQKNLLAQGVDMSLHSIKEALEKMAKAGCGSYQTRRPHEDSRLLWQFSAKKTAALVLGKGSEEDLVQRIEAVSASAVAELDETECQVEFGNDSDVFNTHYFPVAANANIPIRIPASFSAEQVQNLSHFLSVISNSMAQ